MLHHFPFRHIDKTKVNLVTDITPDTDYIQLAGVVGHFETLGARNSKRAVALFKDKSGSIELAWFQGVNWLERSLNSGASYRIFGRVSFFQGKPQIVHPEMELLVPGEPEEKNYLEPVYPTTEKLKAKGLSGRQIGKLSKVLLQQLYEQNIPENLPDNLLRQLKLVNRYHAYMGIHFPKNPEEHAQALKRLKFEELFMAQLRLGMLRSNRHRYSEGVVFDTVGELFNSFFKKYIPFELTGSQKRVIKEIRADTAKGRQMNRLLQGDVGSGKTIVAILIMLLAVDNGYQASLMAPTEILAQQHFKNISALLEKLSISVKLLTGSTKTAERKKILTELGDGTINILIGTHALIESNVQFYKLGMVIIDEQHRFGVAQRAKLWEKAAKAPHVLVMTATPIPRTLAMTAYGDLDYSVINELPPGRQPITTVHRFESNRSGVMQFIRSEIEKGRQAYIIYPLIEESATLDYENLMKGYENVKAYFPEPKYAISMLHGRQPVLQKEVNMQRFIQKDTQIMVSTTVIEVGVDIPNATVMVIESAERFGLSQLHQLRGRVGRGGEKSYCILVTNMNIGADARARMNTMVATGDGFEIAEKDLELRGPGDIEGTRQSGLLNFKLANIVQDRQLLDIARLKTEELLESDPELMAVENLPVKRFLAAQKGNIVWSKIS